MEISFFLLLHFSIFYGCYGRRGLNRTSSLFSVRTLNFACYLYSQILRLTSLYITLEANKTTIVVVIEIHRTTQVQQCFVFGGKYDKARFLFYSFPGEIKTHYRTLGRILGENDEPIWFVTFILKV